MTTVVTHNGRCRLGFTGGPTGPFVEEVDAEFWLGRGLAELRAHATFAPLAPGDIVEHRDGLVTGVQRLEQVWVVEATLHLPAATTFMVAPTEEHPAMRAVAECEEDWRRAVQVTRNTAFSFLVSSHSRSWLEDNVEGHPYVEHVDLIRTPGARIDLEHCLAHPNF